MKTILLLAILAAASCTPQAYPPGAPNPLNEPGDDGSLPTVEQLHRENLRAITQDPVRDLWSELNE